MHPRIQSLRFNLLHAQPLRRPRDVVVCKRRHEIVAMVVVGLHAELDALVVACLFGRGN
jgi:hypothetical protein